jgi:hypothetical protein
LPKSSRTQKRAHQVKVKPGDEQARAQKNDSPGWRFLFKVEEKCFGDWQHFCQLISVVVVVLVAVFLLVYVWPWPTGIASGLSMAGLAVRRLQKDRAGP